MTKPNPRVLEVKGVFVEPASAASIGGAIRDIKAGKIKLTSEEANHLAELKADVRNAHFHLGNNQNDYVTTGADTMKEHKITKEGVIQ